MAAGSVVFPQDTYGPGVTNIGPRVVSGNLTRAGFTYDITRHTDPAIVLEIVAEYSIDNGQHWDVIGGLRRAGEVETGGPAGPSGQASFQVAFPNSPKPNARIRGTLTITGGAIVTSGEMWWA